MRTCALVLPLMIATTIIAQTPRQGAALAPHAYPDVRRAIELAVRSHHDAIAANNTDEIVRFDVELIGLYRKIGEPRRAISYALDAKVRAPGHSLLLATSCQLDIALIERSLGLRSECMRRTEAALEHPSLDDRSRIALTALLAASLGEEGDGSGAAVRWNEVISLMRSAPAGPIGPMELSALELARPADPAQALFIEERLLEDASRARDKAAMIEHANNSGLLQLRLERNEKASYRFDQALALATGEEFLGTRLDITTHRAVLWNAQGRRDEAIRSLDGVERESTRNNLHGQRARALIARAGINYQAGLLTAASEDATQAAEISESHSLTAVRSDALELLRSIARLRGQPAEADAMEKRSATLEQRGKEQERQLAAERDALRQELQGIERKAQEEATLRDREQARYQHLSDEAARQEQEMTLLRVQQELERSQMNEVALERERTEKELSLAMAALDAEKRERTITGLKHEKEVAIWSAQQRLRKDSLELLSRSNELLATEARLVATEGMEQRAAKRIVLLLLLLAAAICAALTYGVMIHRRKNREIRDRGQAIERMNLEITEVNRKVMGSIDYARHIQSAITPGEDLFRELFPGSFLVYRPLDVVSGDLPYLHRMGNSIYIGAIDCTGHGVPAAMLSFIAHYSLTNLIDTMHGAPCGEIVEALHAAVRDTLRDQNPGLPFNDGMDLSLCCIDRDTGSFHFAGAQLPVIITSDQGVEVVSGDRVSVGDRAFQEHARIATHFRTLGPNDRLIILSDGFIHQFGGEQGRRKFSLQRLAAALSSTRDMGPDQARDHLIHLFDQWRNGTDQTDDVLLIGISRTA